MSRSRFLSDHRRQTAKSRHLATARAPHSGGASTRAAYPRAQLAEYARIAPPTIHAAKRRAVNGPLEVGPDGAASSASAAAACRGRSGAHEEWNEGAASAKWSAPASSIAPRRSLRCRRALSSASTAPPAVHLRTPRRRAAEGGGVSARGMGGRGSKRCVPAPSADLPASGERARRPMLITSSAGEALPPPREPGVSLQLALLTRIECRLDSRKRTRGARATLKVASDARQQREQERVPG